MANRAYLGKRVASQPLDDDENVNLNNGRNDSVGTASRGSEDMPEEQQQGEGAMEDGGAQQVCHLWPGRQRYGWWFCQPAVAVPRAADDCCFFPRFD